MNKQSNKSEALDAIEAIAERAERGEDVSGHLQIATWRNSG